jgi:hypothetical protein
MTPKLERLLRLAQMTDIHPLMVSLSDHEQAVSGLILRPAQDERFVSAIRETQ